MEACPPNVFVCDPQPFTLQGIEVAFRQAGLTVLGATSDPSPCLAAPDAVGPVIYFVDHSPGGAYGARLISGLIEADPRRRVVVSSAHEHLSMIASAYEAGASAFVNKQASPRQVLDVLFAVGSLPHARVRHYPGNLAQTLADYYVSGGRADASPRRLLTDRQLTVFQMIAEGVGVTEVAERLRVNRRTVGNHLVAIRRRLNIPREHFRSCAIEHRLIDPLRPLPDAERIQRIIGTERYIRNHSNSRQSR